MTDPHIAEPDRPWVKARDVAAKLNVQTGLISKAIRQRKLDGFIIRKPGGRERTMLYVDQVDKVLGVITQMTPGPDWTSIHAAKQREGRKQDRRQAIARGDILPGRGHN